MCDEAIPLGRLARVPATGDFEGGEETIHTSCVVLHQIQGIVELGAVLNGNTAIQVSGNDVMEFTALQIIIIIIIKVYKDSLSKL